MSWNGTGGTGSYEKLYFSRGNEFPVFDLCGMKIGIQICYDRKYPEGSRLLALKGEEILFMPICAATYGETKLRGNTWELPLQARAYENGVYVVAVNRCGLEQGRNHIGRSMIVDPVGADIVDSSWSIAARSTSPRTTRCVTLRPPSRL